MEKRTALGISLGLHTAFFAALMYSPTIPLKVPDKSPSEYQQEFAGKEDQIIWYHFKKLPEIRPPERKAQRRPLRAETKAEQTIVSSPKNAPKRRQVVIAPVPDIAPPPLDLPNLIAVKLPPKAFTTPPDLVRPEPAKIDAPDVPDAKYEPIAKAELPVDRLPSRAYVPPAPVQPKPAARIEAPTEAPSEAYQVKLVPDDIPSTRLPSRKFVPPAEQKRGEARRIQAIEEAEPAVTSPMASGSLLPSAKLPVRAIAVPTMDGPPGDVTMAIAGLKPSNLSVELPAAASPAQFSAGEKVRPEGATSEGSGKIAAVVNDLYARGPNAPAKPDLLAMSVAPRSTQALIDDMARRREASASFPAPAPTHVTNAPDPRFNGREVYMMAIQMANLTSASGSWLMWYAERTARAAASAPIAAPVPHRKVDPRYDPTMIADHLHGRVQLYGVIGRDGHVSSIEVLRGDDERLDRSAREALSKWEFYPATRNGEPIDVDVVVEIPFVLASPPPK